jgi:hypothetical protein
MPRLVSRNPFARHELTSRTEHYRPSATCDWCGSPGRSLKSGLVSLKVYSIEPDDSCFRPGHNHDLRGRFCSLSCCKSFHDFEDV